MRAWQEVVQRVIVTAEIISRDLDTDERRELHDLRGKEAEARGALATEIAGELRSDALAARW
jgi:hypothetical protein